MDNKGTCQFRWETTTTLYFLRCQIRIKIDSHLHQSPPGLLSENTSYCFRAMKLFDWDLEDEYFHSLYVEGDHHPSMRGSYLAALLHFMSLYNVPVVSEAS